MTRPNLIEAEVLRRARLDHVCPRCGATPGTRCRTMFGEDRRAAIGRDTPHPERVALAWRTFVEGGQR
jgi:hypothetical protein